MHPQPRHSITADPANRLVRMTLVGLWSPADFEAFQREADELAASVPQALRKNVRVLIDLREFAVQASSLTDLTRDMLAKFENEVEKTAVLASNSSLQKLQIQRVLAAANFAFFEAEQDATAWLLTDVQ